MLKKGTFLAVFFFLTSAFALAQTAEKAVVLQWKFQKGQVLNYRISDHMNVAVSMPMGDQKGTIERLSEIELTILEVDSSGDASASLRVTRIMTKIDMGPAMPATNFDTAKKEDAKKLDSLPPQMRGIKQLLKKKYKVKLYRSGKSGKIEGLDVTNKFVAGIISKALMEEVLVGFPMGPISKGANWTKNQTKQMANMPIEIEASYTFGGFETVNNKKCAKIATAEKWKIDFKSNPMAKRLKIKVAKSEGKGKILFSTTEGKLVLQELKGEMEIAMEGKLGGQELKITQKVKILHKVELITSKEKKTVTGAK